MELNRTDKAIIKRVFKGAEKNNRPEFAGAIPFQLYYDEKPMYAFTDTQRIIVCDDPGDFPILDDSKSRMIKSIMDQFVSYKCDVYDTLLEDVKTSKAKRKEEKSRIPYIVNTGKGKIYLDHDFLIDAIRFTETNAIYVDRNGRYLENGNYINAVYMDNEQRGKYCRMAMILPVNVGVILKKGERK